MTIAVTNTRNDYTATAGQTVFAYTFFITQNSDLQVYQNGVLLTLKVDPSMQISGTGNYTVTGAGGTESGGNVTLESGATLNDPIAILRVVPLTQLSDYVANEGLPADRVEADYDKLTTIAQQQEEQFARTTSLLSSSTFKNLTMPDPVASQFLQWRTDLIGFQHICPAANFGAEDNIGYFGCNGVGIISNNKFKFDGTDMTIGGIIFGGTSPVFDPEDQSHLDLNVNDPYTDVTTSLDLTSSFKSPGIRFTQKGSATENSTFFRINTDEAASAFFFSYEDGSGEAMRVNDNGPSGRPNLTLHGNLLNFFEELLTGGFQFGANIDIGDKITASQPERRPRDIWLTGGISLTPLGDLRGREFAGTSPVKFFILTKNPPQPISDVIAIGREFGTPAQFTDIQWGTPLVALGGGAAPVFGTIGGTGPAVAAQNTWMHILDSAGVSFWVPAWK